ncbi:MAG: YbaK/EbsC family protein [Actinomycetota bacterium]|nr:YbaK/EbsC family protein [Actinomycetota bacterium]
MTTPTMGTLELSTVGERPELLADPVRIACATWDVATNGAAWVAAIDGSVSDTAAFCDRYDVPMEVSANCVVVSGKRSGEERWAAVLVLANTRADINGVVRRRLDVRKISFAPMDEATDRTGMEYGGITPIGLPAGWPILIDESVTTAGPVVIGSGIRDSKIIVDGAALATLPGAEVVIGLTLPDTCTPKPRPGGQP